MKIFIGSDHAGYELKEKLVPFLKESGFDVEDKGAFEYDETDDYPDFVRLVALEVADTLGSRGIILGKSGQGEAMCANRIEGVRAVVWYGGNEEILTLSRMHNDANILSLGADFVGEDVLERVKLWLETPFSENERHVRRISKFR